MQEIVLALLRVDDVGRLVADALRSERNAAEPLAQLVHEKTSGNPFFAIQFLTALAEEGLLRFDPEARAWIWDLARIRAKGYTDNVVILMAGKLKRLSATTQEALKQLACLGNVAEVATLALVHGETEEAIHTALWEAVRAGLIFQQESTYKFLHDRIQEAAYALIPDSERAMEHLRIGRVLLASMTGDGLAEHVFDVANQFNRGAALLSDRDEKAHVATIDLSAGRKARASAAYTSARGYFSAGMALLDEGDWGSHYELTFSLWLERAECELLSGNFEKAEQLIVELLQRAASNVEFADASCLKIELHVLKGELPQAVGSALTCLRLFGIDIPGRPSWEQVQAEYETVWQSLKGRPIESLVDLPIMTDPELQAAMQVLSVVTPATFFTNIHLFCLLVCRMANFSVQHGMSGASAHGFAHLGSILGTVFHRYSEGYRFAKLSFDLVEKHGFIAYQAKAYDALGVATHWTHSITTAIDFHRAAIRAAIETGDLTYACYGIYLSLAGLHLRNDPLDAVCRETEMALDFVRKAGFRDVADIIRSQQRFIATMQGRTATFSTFSDAQFDGAAFEAQLTTDRMAMTVCFYWILKLKALFLSGDYAEAFAAAGNAKPLLWAATGQVQLLDYFYFTALTVAALYENASADEQADWRDLLAAHREQLCEWVENYPPTFADKHLLVLAEIARVEGRAFDAMQLYEQAIQSARANGFVQNEALAHEVAARFFATHGFETMAHAYLRKARNCYERWGALGKVKQLDERYPRLYEERLPTSTASTIGTPIRQLDVETVVKASQAISSEIVLPKLIEKLVRIAVEHAGAERGLLILLRGDVPQIEAEATTGHRRVEVTVRQAAVTPSDIPQSVLHYVIRTQERLVLDDAAVRNLYSDDEYVLQNRPRSVLCLPIVKQTKLIGALYLENNLTPYAFTSDRVAVLEMLASQAAISVENARLYSEQQRSEDRLRNVINTIPAHAWSATPDGYVDFFSQRLMESTGRSLEDLLGWGWGSLVHPDDFPSFLEDWRAALAVGEPMEGELRLRLADGDYRWFLMRNVPLRDELGNITRWYGVGIEIEDRKRAEEQLRQAQVDLVHISRVTTMGELTASLAHEINQPITGTVTNGNACVRWLAADPPNLDEARDAARRIVRDGKRAGDIIARIRALATKTATAKIRLDMNQTIQEVIALVRDEMRRNSVTLGMELANDLSPVLGDRVQLQQVLLNLIMNGVEAMSTIEERSRKLVIRTQNDEADQVRVTVQDSGIGLAPQSMDRIFDAFYTTKHGGMGMGLSISRSIVQNHGGRLWAVANDGSGTTFQFNIPKYQ
jgi:PAS domain S-box-containing protein